MAERRKLIEDLEDLMRLSRDVRMALDFRNRLDETGGVVDLVTFGTGESVFTTLSATDLAQVDSKIGKMIGALKAKAAELKQV